MEEVLSALIPPAVVATVFCTFVIKLLRKEMAPRTSDGRLVSETDTASGRAPAGATTATASATDGVAADDGAKGSVSSRTELPADAPDSADR
ncbi:hypothetical protein LG943_04245 [Streptomonospora sp. S1-112]|uniref:Uncharacterized protein n=1 Tax=Streptomonospora mangrovi TaxID=2883123 RepID=A0A9X3NKM2_9ACTN|nr:hypothetical protein [Streptomonospora mangrovi]MDA0563544.1 hypothetical protein [Streptomonospora mangrovi]